MIDKLDVRVGWSAPFSAEVAHIIRETKGTSLYPFHPSQHYAEVGDLRPYGIPAVVHLGCKHGKAAVEIAGGKEYVTTGAGGNHKIEIIDAGKESLSAHLATMEKIFYTDPRAHEIMRVDLAADVPEVGVSYFHERARVKFKQWGAEIGEVQYSQMGKREVQTVYYGKRPNCYRIYNKIAEWGAEYRRMMRDVEAPPAFVEIYGHGEQDILTRVERQCGGGRVPRELAADGETSRVGDLRKLAPEFNPFDRLDFLCGGKPEPRRCDYTTADYAAGMWLRERATEWGMQQLRSWIFQQEQRNTGRFIERFHDFLPDDGGGITGERLYQIYRESVEKQLAA